MMVHFDGDIKRSIERVTNVFSSINDSKLSIRVDRSTGHVMVTRMQAAMDVRFPDKLDNSIMELFLTHAIDAERIAPGGFDECITLTLNELKAKRLGITNPHASIHSTSLSSFFQCERPTMDDVDSLYNKFEGTIDTKIVRNVIELAGFAGNVFIERADQRDRSVIQRTIGSTFKWFVPTVRDRIALNDVLIVPIDGCIENESEIHNLLVRIAEVKTNTLLIVRSVSDDVMNTIMVNNNKGTFNVQIACVPYEPRTINAMIDASIVSGSPVISSEAGDLISSLVPEKFSIVKKMIIDRNQITIVNESRIDDIRSHTFELRTKMIGADDEMVQKLSLERVKSLMANNVTVKIADDRNFVLNSNLIDYVLRSYRSLLDHGIINVDGKRRHAGSLIAGCLHSSKCVQILNDLGSVIS